MVDLREKRMAHVRRNLLKRWGIDFTEEQIEQNINKAIQEGDSVPLGRASTNRTVHRVSVARSNPATGVEEVVMPVFLYDKGTSTVMTVYAEDMDLSSVIVYE